MANNSCYALTWFQICMYVCIYLFTSPDSSAYCGGKKIPVRLGETPQDKKANESTFLFLGHGTIVLKLTSSSPTSSLHFQGKFGMCILNRWNICLHLEAVSDSELLNMQSRKYIGNNNSDTLLSSLLLSNRSILLLFQCTSRRPLRYMNNLISNCRICSTKSHAQTQTHFSLIFC